MSTCIREACVLCRIYTVLDPKNVDKSLAESVCLSQYGHRLDFGVTRPILQPQRDYLNSEPSSPWWGCCFGLFSIWKLALTHRCCTQTVIEWTNFQYDQDREQVLPSLPIFVFPNSCPIPPLLGKCYHVSRWPPLLIAGLVRHNLHFKHPHPRFWVLGAMERKVMQRRAMQNTKRSAW